MQPYERFAAWRAAHQLALEVYTATERWPPTERYGLVAQARRAAFSGAVNIAEGAARRGSAEFRRFLDIAHSSNVELAYILRLAHDLGYTDPATWTALDQARNRAGALTWKLYRSLRPP